MGGALGIGLGQDGYYTREQVLEEIGRLHHQLDRHRTEVRRLLSEREELRTQVVEAASQSLSFAGLLGFWEQGPLDEEVTPNLLVTTRRAEELELACVEEEEQEVLVEDLLNFLLLQCPLPSEDAQASAAGNDSIPPLAGSSGYDVNASMDERNPEQGLTVDFSNANRTEQGLPAEEGQPAHVNAPPDDDLEQKEWNSMECPVIEATGALKAIVPHAQTGLFY